MGNWKIKPHTKDTTYSDTTGYTFTIDPRTISISTQKSITSTKVPFQDKWIVMNQGTNVSDLNVEGIMYSNEDITNLFRYVASSTLDSNLRQTKNNVYRLYISSSEFYLVMPISAELNRTAINPLGYSYVLSFLRIDPFKYSETENSSYKSGSSTLTFNKDTDIGTNNGTAYTLPRFEITNTSGSSITSISITDGTNTLSWSGTLSSGSTLYIFQDYVSDTFGPEPVGLINNVVSGSISGNLIIFPEKAKPLGNIVITASNTINAYVKWRERDW
ncbi:MAG: hypothetical protein QXL51_01025 [Candidatus Aenigmatarchaeota archaeon]